MRKKKRSEDSGFNVWRSYSDMMAGVLLLFVLIMCVTLFQAQKSYNESIKERDEKIALQEQYTAEILAQQNALDEKDVKLSSQSEQLDKQKKLLAELAAQLKQQQSDLDEKTSMLATQQKKIDNIIGVKADVIESLQQEFSKNNVSVDIDPQTGALTLNASVLFDYDKAELTEEGKAELSNILPIYCKVLLQGDYKKYLAEIIIDGYTDTDGDYYYNLELSQKRSLAVAEYLTEIRENFLNAQQISELQTYLTVNGHSMANPVLDANGNVDKNASRRVEVKFRLKDDEMIDELNNIMTSENN
ncbi:MAG: OmpA family protein [Clostridia bacterium]|nr:OmpA family protein [Clostridia bacterium]MDY5555313.1 OmpA family protein [Blautia sp.]